jgi:hypothetical protein
MHASPKADRNPAESPRRAMRVTAFEKLPTGAEELCPCLLDRMDDLRLLRDDGIARRELGEEDALRDGA